jgi:hypothetical protein
VAAVIAAKLRRFARKRQSQSAARAAPSHEKARTRRAFHVKPAKAYSMSRKLRSCSERDGWRSLRSALASI